MTGAAAPALSLFTSAAELERRPLVVSLHDVAPVTRARCEHILREMAHHGVRVCSLLVVPDYHHTGRAVEDRQFVQWLRDLEGAGHEIVIHGYFHARARRADETLRAQVISRCYTKDEGEFYDIAYEEARRRISQARDEFVAAGLRPRGFIAPAWLLSKEAERAATDAEMEYTTRLASVHDLRTRVSTPARSLVYSVRSSWRRGVSLAWNDLWARLLREAPLLRLAIHPRDFEHAGIWRHIASLLERFAETRTPTTYRDWIAEQRATRDEA